MQRKLQLLKIASYIFYATITFSSIAHAGVDPDELQDAGPTQENSTADEGGSIADNFLNTLKKYKPVKAPAAHAPKTIDFYASDKVGMVFHERDSSGFGIENGRLGVGVLFTETRDMVIHGTLMLDTTPEILPNTRLSVGTRTYLGLLGIENNDAVGIAMGFQAAYELPIDRFPLELAVGLFYAPDVLSFGQADRIFDWNVDLGLPMRERLTVYVGYRYLQFDTRPGQRDVDDRVHVGLRFDLK